MFIIVSFVLHEGFEIIHLLIQTFAHFRLSKTPVTPEWRPYSVPTAFQKLAEPRAARCANASNAMQTLCNRIERHAAAFIFSMLKTNAAAWRFHSVLDSTLWGLLERRGRVMSAPRARCKDAV